MLVEGGRGGRRRPPTSARSPVGDAVAVVSDRALLDVLADETARPLRIRVPDGPEEVPVTADNLGAASTPWWTTCSVIRPPMSASA
jgi:hypothetical protein